MSPENNKCLVWNEWYTADYQILSFKIVDTGLPAHAMVFIFFTFLRGIFKSSVFNSFKNAIFIFNICGNWSSSFFSEPENRVLHIFILQCRVEQIFTFVFMLKVPSSNLPENPQGAQTPNTTQFGWHRLHTDTTHTHTPTTLFRHQQHNRVWEESSFIITKKSSSILIELDTHRNTAGNFQAAWMTSRKVRVGWLSTIPRYLQDILQQTDQSVCCWQDIQCNPLRTDWLVSPYLAAAAWGLKASWILSLPPASCCTKDYVLVLTYTCIQFLSLSTKPIY